MLFRQSLRWCAITSGVCLVATSCSAPPGTSGSETPESSQAESLTATAATSDVETPIPADFVLTPAGYVHPDCLHRIPDGAVVDSAGNVVVNGAIKESYGECKHPRLRSLHSSSQASAPVPSDSPHSWVYTKQSAPAGQFWTAVEAVQKVPNPPLRNDGQTLFYWNGLQTNDNNWLVQPVLQWGVSALGGGPYWAIASWFVGGNNQVYTTSNLVRVQPGDTIGYYVEDTGSFSTTSDDQLLIEALDETQGVYAGITVLANRSLWTSPGIFAIPAALEFESAPNCNTDVPDGLFNPVLVFSGTVHPPTYNNVTYAPTNMLEINQSGSHCVTGICDPATFPCFGLSGSATDLYF